MNERIRQLVEQAFIITTDGKIGHVNNYMVEKFAELIVKECASVNYNSPFQDGEFHAREVLEHFGVEE
jgi:hypothetical protein